MCGLFMAVFYFPTVVRAQEAALPGYLCDDVKKTFFAAPVGAGREYVAQRPNALPGKFVMPKPAGVKRIFITGESVASLLGQSEDRTAAGEVVSWLKSAVLPAAKQAKGDARIEIINCGMGAYKSVQIYGVIKEVLTYEPDLLVVLSGNNEELPDICPGLEQELLRREHLLLKRYYSYKHSREEALKKASLKIHGQMLAKMARAAKQAKVPVVFCTLPVNLSDMPPAGVLPVENDAFTAGHRLFYAGKIQEALERFLSGLSGSPRDAFLNYYAAKSLERLGRLAEAKPYFVKAADIAMPTGSRAGRERNELIRTVARAENACLADLEQLFYDLSPGGLPGFSQFTDAVHWREPYNKLVWKEIFRSAAACGIKGLGGVVAERYGGRETPLKDFKARLSYVYAWSNDRQLAERALAELAYLSKTAPALLKKAARSPEALSAALIKNFWSKAEKPKVESFFPVFLSQLAEVKRRAGDHAEALLLCERALSYAPGDQDILLQRAQVFADLGRTAEAGREFRGLASSSGPGLRAVALARAYGLEVPALPAKPPAPDKQVLRSQKLSTEAAESIRSGDFMRAEKLSREALQASPGNLEAGYSLCAALAGANKKELALEECQKFSDLISFMPGTIPLSFKMLAADADFQLYKLLYSAGRGADAQKALRRAAQNAPPAWPRLTEARAALKNGVK